MKKMLLAGLFVVLGIAATGCTRGEVSDGSNGVGVGIGIGYPDPWHPGYPGERYPQTLFRTIHGPQIHRPPILLPILQNLIQHPRSVVLVVPQVPIVTV